eukprot:TRINITY_DN43187_c0_g1_i1.p1 TRINITY_DN43187_c0_g1~~TRINITY_DN43187_c0_g1_i1.p1  ORF type:complete len:293 (+),score=45.06 TRINITY_DN43187_c0_g1_i1:57-935(+)
MSSQSNLRIWLLVVAGLRSLSVVLGLVWPDVLARSLFAAAPQELTALGARVFASWTLMTCCLCILCAREGAAPSTSIFSATAFSFIVALALFVPELALHETMTLRSAASPLIVAVVSLVWMAVVRWPGHGFSSWVIVVAGTATVVITTAIVRDAHSSGFPDRLDATLRWDEHTARALFVQLGDTGRTAYQAMYLAPLGDLALPVCYAPALSALCLRLFPAGWERVAALLPLIAGACDLVENFSVLALLESYPSWSEAQPQLAIRVGPWATVGKWVSLTLTLALLGKHVLMRR